MSQDESVTIVPEEEVYEKIEKAVLALPEVSHFTADGYQEMISGISQALAFGAIRGFCCAAAERRESRSIYPWPSIKGAGSMKRPAIYRW